MIVTLILSLILMVALFLMILATVGLIKEKKLFTTEPPDVHTAAQEHEPPFPGARPLGWVLLILCIFIILGAFVYGGRNGVQNGFGFWQFFGRFMIMLSLWKVFDIVFLDWFLLTKSHFFQHFYPETEGCDEYHQSGFNRKEQIKQTVALPFVALFMAWICTLF